MIRESAYCDRCHLEGIHGGWMAVEGRAGERLVWRLGIRDGEPEETWIAEGDDEVRQIRRGGEAG